MAIGFTQLNNLSADRQAQNTKVEGIENEEGCKKRSWG